jgi:hypothetical protein
VSCIKTNLSSGLLKDAPNEHLQWQHKTKVGVRAASLTDAARYVSSSKKKICSNWITPLFAPSGTRKWLKPGSGRLSLSPSRSLPRFATRAIPLQ